MLPRRRSQSGYRGVRARPNGTFTAEIRSGEERVALGTFETAIEAARKIIVAKDRENYIYVCEYNFSRPNTSI